MTPGTTDLTVRPPAEPAPDELLLGFARALRAAGVGVTADRERTFLLAVATVGMQERSHVYWAGRATLTSTPADFAAYDEVFERWFGGEAITPGRRVDVVRPPVVQAPLDSGEGLLVVTRFREPVYRTVARLAQIRAAADFVHDEREVPRR